MISMFGFTKPSNTLRVGYGKFLGLLFGIIAYFALTIFAPETDFTFRFGFLIWYLTLGAVIGLMGIFTSNPLFNLNISWWMRGLVTGAWFNFVLLMFIFDEISVILLNIFGAQSVFSTPWWFVIEGAFIGVIIDYLLTRFAGEGSHTVVPELK
jgi:hypothetical protein